MYHDYRIIIDEFPDRLAHKVNAFRDNNEKYQPIGQPFYADGKFYQAIGIYEPEKINITLKMDK